MNAITSSTPAPLVYNGIGIGNRGEMLSLTDMWKAAGSDPQQAPAKWRALPGTMAFVEHVEVTIGKSDSDLFHVKNGGRQPGTFAHWQIAIAYAKYLSPEFHMWCNEVVRERMEGRSHSAVRPDTLEQIERSFGIVRSLIHKVTEIERRLPAVASEMVEPLVRARLAEMNFRVRHGKTAQEIADQHGLPRGIRGFTIWLGNRLTEMGATIDYRGRYDRGTTAIRLFDPDRAAIFMRNGLRQRALSYAAERQGQGKLRLVGGRA